MQGSSQGGEHCNPSRNKLIVIVIKGGAMPARFSYSRGRKGPCHNIVVVLLALLATASWVIRGFFGAFSNALQVSTATIGRPKAAAPGKAVWDHLPDE